LEQHRFLSAKEKFQIYLEAESIDKFFARLLRREGHFSAVQAAFPSRFSDGALVRLSTKPRRKSKTSASSEIEAHN
jgi:hypothetical protein